MFFLRIELFEVVYVILNILYELIIIRIWDYLGLFLGILKSFVYKVDMGRKIIVGVIDIGLLYLWRKCF